MKEGRQTRKRGLPELTESNGFVGLEPLEPNAEAQLMASAGDGDAVFGGIKFSVDEKVAAVVAACQAKLSPGIRCRAATDTYGTHRMPDQKTRTHTPLGTCY